MIPHAALASHAAEIRQLGKCVVEDVIEIGRRLKECKQLVGHGRWLPWLEQQFGWSEKTAERFMRVHSLAGKFDNLSDLEVPISGLYLLAAPSTPKAARDEVLELAAKGERVTHAQVKTAIVSAKRPTSAKPKSANRGVPEPRATPEKRTSGLPTGSPTAPEAEIGPNSIGENERLRARNAELENENHRLKTKIIALESEVAELKAAPVGEPAPNSMRKED